MSLHPIPVFAKNPARISGTEETIGEGDGLPHVDREASRHVRTRVDRGHSPDGQFTA